MTPQEQEQKLRNIRKWIHECDYDEAAILDKNDSVFLIQQIDSLKAEKETYKTILYKIHSEPQRAIEFINELIP